MALGGSKQRALLALLLLHANRVVSRDRLIDELWDGSPPDTASTALQVHVSQLRKALGRDAIVTQAPGYLVTRRAGRARSRALRAARRRRRRAATPTTPPRRCGRRSRSGAARRWPTSTTRSRGPERAQLEERHASALEQRIDADLELGRHAELVSELEALVREDPLRERRRGAADARALPVGPAGRRARRVSQRQEAARRRARPRARRGAAAARESNPRARSGARRARSSAGGPSHRPARARRPGRLPWPSLSGAILLAGALAGARARAHRRLATPSPSCRTRSPPSTRRPAGSRPTCRSAGTRWRSRSGEGAVWVANSDSETLVRIDPKSKDGRPRSALGTDVADVAVGFGSVWVAGGNGETLTRIDPNQNAPEAPIDLGKRRRALASARFPRRDRCGERLDHARQQAPADRPGDQRGSNLVHGESAPGPRRRCGSRMGDAAETSTCSASTRPPRKSRPTRTCRSYHSFPCSSTTLSG